MQVVRLCGTSVNDIYLVLDPDDWQLGDPEGLAHWNGVTWQWLRRLEKGCTHDLRLSNAGVVHLDPDGLLSIWKTNGQWATQCAPEHRSTANPNKFKGQGLGPAVDALAGNLVSYSSFLPLDDDAILAAGDYGTLFLFRNGAWTLIETNTSEDLRYVFGTPERAYVCGKNGTILRVEDSRCYAIESGTTALFSHIDRGIDGTLFVASVGKDCSLIQIENDRVVAIHKSPGGIHTIAAVSRTEVYCAASWHGLLLWNGEEFTTALPADLNIAQIAKLGRSVAAATGLRGQNSLFVNGPHWEKIDINLDESFIARPEE